MDAPTNNRKLTGRIVSGPNSLITNEILRPQFDYELQYLLQSYILIEQALVVEYVRMQILSPQEGRQIVDILASITPELMNEKAASSMTDIAFSIELIVFEQLPQPVPQWHVDRSRNDLQATAQRMAGRNQLLLIMHSLQALIEACLAIAKKYTGLPMPGYTHYQAAQIITPGFYFSGFADVLLQTAVQFVTIYDSINESPLGAGALSGQALPWDRTRLAHLLGFRKAHPHAMVSVASRDWIARISAECAVLGISLSRFATDLIMWSDSEHQFFELPDQLSGISSAMPQKKNYPILERIRGRTAHMTAVFTDIAMGQRNTPFTNLVEVSKEASSSFLNQLSSTLSTLRLFTTILHHIQFNESHLHKLCQEKFFGGFHLANRLTLDHQLPYREAQVIAGKYILAILQSGQKTHAANPHLLQKICQAAGYTIEIEESTLNHIFAVEAGLQEKTSMGSTNPNIVEKMLSAYAEQLDSFINTMRQRKAAIERIPAQINKAIL